MPHRNISPTNPRFDGMTHDSVAINGQYSELPTEINDSVLPQPTVESSIEANLETMRAISNLELRTESSVDPKAPSGFMLISVRHSSVSRRMGNRAHSLSLPPKCRTRSELLPYSIDSSRDGSSHSSSQSHLTDEEYNNDGFYGSGSVDAEEFEDDDMDEEEITDNCTLVVGSSTKHLRSHFEMTSQCLMGTYLTNGTPEVQHNALDSRCVSKPTSDRSDLIYSLPCSKSWTTTAPLNNRLQPNAHTVNLPVRELIVPSRQNRRPVYRKQLLQEGNYDEFQNNSLLNSSAATIQRNTSHVDSQVVPCNLVPAVSVHTAPVSGHASPIQNLEYALMLDPSSFHEPYINGHVPSQSFSNQSLTHDTSSSLNPALHPQFSGPAHGQHTNSIQQTVAFLRQLHTGAPADLASGDLREEPNTISNRLIPNVATISVASLPNLQPASRFRKARIHETVEQWSHGRATIHDCRLKVVPDWVWELHKKPSILEGDVTASVVQKVSCSSCVATKQPNSVEKRPAIARAGGRIDINSTTERTCLDRPHSKSDASPPRSAILTCEAYRHNLFSFWEGGCRVNATTIKTHDQPQDKANQTTDVCPVCTGMVILKHVSIPQDLSSKSLDNVFASTHFPGQCLHLRPGDLSTGREKDNLSSIPIPEVALSPTSSSTLSANKPTDPATAYLIHHQLNIANGITSVVTESEQNFVTSPLIAEQIQETYHTASFSPSNDGLVELSAENVLQPLKQESVVDISGLVPPTSPALAPPDNTQSKWSDINSSSVVPPPDANGVVRNMPSDLSALNALQVSDFSPLQNGEHHGVLRLGDCSGKYHNILQFDSLCKSNGVEGQSNDPSWANLMRICRTTTKEQSTTVTETVKPPIVSRELNPSDYNTTNQSGVSRSRSLTQSLVDKIFRESKAVGGTRPALPQRLETRISESVDVIRATIEEAFREELAAAHSENLALLSEVERLSNEVSTLRGYQTAFYALRPFVSPEIWDHLCSQQLDGFQGVIPHPTSSFSLNQNGFAEDPS